MPADADPLRLAHQRCDVDIDEYYRHAGILGCELSDADPRPDWGHRAAPLVTAAVMTACVIASRTRRSPHRRRGRGR